MYDGIDEGLMNHMPYLEQVAANDVAVLRQKEATYQGSWRRNGGSHAWQMILRKIDRLVNMLKGPSKADISFLMSCAGAVQIENALYFRETLIRTIQGSDIFAALDGDTSGADGTPLAEVQDLRRYLMLVEARMLAQAELRKGRDNKPLVTSAAPLPVPAEDSNRHADRVSNNMDHKAGVLIGNNKWKVQPVINAALLPNLTPSLAARFIHTGGTYAVVDRKQYPDNELETTFPFKFHATLPNHEWNKIAMWEKELYEPCTGVENEMQLKELFRSHHWSL